MTNTRGGERPLTNTSCDGGDPRRIHWAAFATVAGDGATLDDGDRRWLGLERQTQRIAPDSCVNGSGVGAAPRDVSATSLSVDFWRLRPARPTSRGGGGRALAAAQRQSLLALGATNGRHSAFDLLNALGSHAPPDSICIQDPPSLRLWQAGRRSAVAAPDTPTGTAASLKPPHLRALLLSVFCSPSPDRSPARCTGLSLTFLANAEFQRR
ncbi:hypothetical protein MRX96_015214 [Rhipicephalus microplus]